MKIIPRVNPNSKAQQEKAEYLKKHPIQYVKCEKCGISNTTLHNIGGKYYCGKHIPKEK